jgi:acyl dehydratase
MNNKKYFEDLVLDEPSVFGDYLVTEEEIIDFASKWDPQPFHLDLEAANASIFGGLSACSAHNFSIMSRLLFEKGGEMNILAGLGTESMKFINPSRPGDKLSIRHVTIEKRESKSRPGAGIVKSKTQLVNQNGEVVVEAIAAALVAKRPT